MAGFEGEPVVLYSQAGGRRLHQVQQLLHVCGEGFSFDAKYGKPTSEGETETTDGGTGVSDG